MKSAVPIYLDSVSNQIEVFRNQFYGKALSEMLVASMSIQQWYTAKAARIDSVLCEAELICSITTSDGESPLSQKRMESSSVRKCPVVSYFNIADSAMVLANKGEGSCFYFIRKECLSDIRDYREFKFLGLKGIVNSSFNFDICKSKPEAIVESKKVFNTVFSPIGLLFWSLSWLYSTRSYLKKHELRLPQEFVEKATIKLNSMERHSISIANGSYPCLTLDDLKKFNNLKVEVSRFCVEASTKVFEFSPFHEYLEHSNETHLVDVLSSFKMIPNYKLEKLNYVHKSVLTRELKYII